VEVWRVIAAVFVGIGGLLLVMVAIAQARDSAALRIRRNTGELAGSRVLRTTLLGFALLGVTLVLVLTVLPQFVVWTATALIWLILGVVFIAD
jgi:hypothetical protein